MRDLEVVLVERVEELLPLTLTPAGETGSDQPLPGAKTVITGTEVRAEGGDTRA